MDILEKNNEKIYCDVSVIIPCYNCSSTIERSINSILNQTKLPRELILVDDKSTDNTLEIINNLAKKHQDISFIILSLSENSGPGSARNVAWDIASQTWLAFLDADDIWHPQKLEIQLEYLKSDPEVFLSGHRTEVYAGEFIKYDISICFKSFIINKISMIISNRFPTRSVVVRKDIPYRFKEKGYYSEDYKLWLELVFLKKKCTYLDITLAYSFKPEYSKGGLSGHLIKHEKGELETIKIIYQKRYINFLTYLLFSTFSFMKFLRRLIISKFFQ